MSFNQLGLNQILIQALKDNQWIIPTRVQSEVIPKILQGKDIMCLAQTGSGKTLAYLTPLIHQIIQKQINFRGYGLIIAPTRQLCIQIQQTIESLSKKSQRKMFSNVCLTGGLSLMNQVINIAKNPQIIVSTPGRLLQHLNQTIGFHVNQLKYFVIDQADQILSLGHEKQLRQILGYIPKQRKSVLVSATLSARLINIKYLSLNKGKMVQLGKVSTVATLKQFYLQIDTFYLNHYIIYILKLFKNKKILMFVETCLSTIRFSKLLNIMGLKSIQLHGQLNQNDRLQNIEKFKKNLCNILVATDVAARGLDIQEIDLILNSSVPSTPQIYIHRVGRTARMGKQGMSITIVNQYTIQQFTQIQNVVGKMQIYELKQEDVLKDTQLVEQKIREVGKKMRKYKNNKQDYQQQDQIYY